MVGGAVPLISEDVDIGAACVDDAGADDADDVVGGGGGT